MRLFSLAWLRRLPSLPLWALLALFVVGTPRAALADDVAKKQFLKAQELYDAGEYAVALPLFERALQTTGSPNARLYLARCQRELGSRVTAYNEMSQTFAEASKLAQDEPKYERTRDAARKEIAELEPKVARVTVVLSFTDAGDAEAAELSVTINNTPRELALLSTPFAVASGQVAVQAKGAGILPASETITISIGELNNVSLAIELEKVESPEEPDDDGLSGVQLAGIGVMALGVGGFVMMGVTGAMAQSKLDELDSDCGGQRCTDAAAADTVDEGETLALLSNVGLGVGIAGVVAGTAMLLFGGNLLDDDAGSSASLWIAPGAASLHVGGRF
jgi:hypothetical protein